MDWLISGVNKDLHAKLNPRRHQVDRKKRKLTCQVCSEGVLRLRAVDEGNQSLDHLEGRE